MMQLGRAIGTGRGAIVTGRRGENDAMLLAILPIGNGAPPVFDTDLLEDILEMKFYRVQTDFEDDRNFPIGFTRRHPA